MKIHKNACNGYIKFLNNNYKRHAIPNTIQQCAIVSLKITLKLTSHTHIQLHFEYTFNVSLLKKELKIKKLKRKKWLRRLKKNKMKKIQKIALLENIIKIEILLEFECTETDTHKTISIRARRLSHNPIFDEKQKQVKQVPSGHSYKNIVLL